MSSSAGFTAEELAKACQSDEEAEQALTRLVEALFEEASGVEDPSPKPTDTSKETSEAICHLIVGHATASRERGLEGPAVDLTEPAMDVITESLMMAGDDARKVGSFVTETFLASARSVTAADNSNRGHYIPALILAGYAHEIAQASGGDEDEPPKKGGTSDDEDPAAAFRRDLKDLFGRRLFALGGSSPPATAPEVRLASPLISDLTREEFDGAMLRPLKFKLMSAPAATMETLSAFFDVLTEAGSGWYVDSHLTVGTNFIGAALKQVQSTTDGVSARGTAVLVSLVKASPAKAGSAVTEALLKAQQEKPADPLLYACFDGVAKGMLALRAEGKEDDNCEWKSLAEYKVLPRLKLRTGDAKDALTSWSEVAGMEASPAAAAASAVAAPAAAATVAAAGAGAAAASEQLEQDVLAKQRARGGGAPASRPGAQSMEASALDDRIAAKQSGTSQSRDNAKAAAAVAGGTAAAAAATSSDDADAAAKARARGPAASKPGAQTVQDLDERIAAKSSAGAAVTASVQREPQPEDDAHDVGAQARSTEDEDARNKILVAGAAATGAAAVVGAAGTKEDDAAAAVGAAPTDGADLSKGAGGEEPSPVTETPPTTETVAARGVVSDGGVEYGETTEPAGAAVDHGRVEAPDVVSGTIDDEGLAVAVAVSPDEEEAFIPAAIEYDPDSKPPLLQNRRFRAYGILSLVIIIVVTVGVSVGVTQNVKKGDDETVEVTVQATMSPTVSPTPAPTTDRDYLKELLHSISGEDTVNDLTTPQGKAADWMLRVDPLQLNEEDENFIQRYIMTTLAFATGHSEWASCGVSVPEGNDTTTPPVDCNATEFNFQTGQEVIYPSINWLSEAQECDWHGAVCSNDGVMRGLDMTENNLVGTIPKEVASLQFLQYFYAIDNSLFGPIPEEIGNMQHLQALELHYNWLSGPIPEKLYDANKLQAINLGANLLSGTLSTRVGELEGLKGYHMFENNFFGTIPTELGSLEYLGFMRLQSIALTGDIPTEFTNLSKLRELILYNTRLGFRFDPSHPWSDPTSGLVPYGTTIPGKIGDMRDLADLRMDRGPLIVGTIPDSFYKLKNLEVFWCFTTFGLGGTISTEIGNLEKLKMIIINQNQMSGTIPDEFGNAKNLEFFWVHTNNFNGTIGDWACELRDLRLVSSYADCGKIQGVYDPIIECSCCTDCCDHATGICLQDD